MAAGRLDFLGPTAKSGLRSAFRALAGPYDAAVRGRLAAAPHPRAAVLAEVIRGVREPLPQEEQRWIDAIEQGRARMLARTDPLVDGAAGEAGPYDAGLTVAGAAVNSKAPVAARLLYGLIRALRPRTVLELGTNVGISSAYQAAALRVNGDGGRLVTMEGSPYRLRLARELHGGLGLDNVQYVHGPFAETLGGTLEGLGTVDLAFIDGHHQYQPTLDYCDAVWAHAAPRTLFVFDDIRWSQGMRDAWARLRVDPRFGLSVDLGSMGLCAPAADPPAPPHRTPRMYAAV